MPEDTPLDLDLFGKPIKATSSELRANTGSLRPLVAVSSVTEGKPLSPIDQRLLDSALDSLILDRSYSITKSGPHGLTTLMMMD